MNINKKRSRLIESGTALRQQTRLMQDQIKKRLPQNNNITNGIPDQIEDDNNVKPVDYNNTNILSTNEADITHLHYYYLSEEADLTELIPSLRDVKPFEDSKTLRIPFYKSINDALMAKAANIRNKVYYVYVPTRIDKLKIYKPAINQVPGCVITKELWALEPIRVVCAGRILVTNNTDNSHIYKLGDSVSELYEWKYRNLVDESNDLIKAGDVKPNKQDNASQTKEKFYNQNLAPTKENYQEPFMEQAVYTRDQCYPVFIVLQHNHTVLANLIKLATGDEYSHAQISFNPSLDPMYSFGNRKISQISPDLGLTIMSPKSEFFRHFKGNYAVYVMYVNKKAFDAMQRTLNIFIENKDKIKYDFANLFSVWFGISSEESERYFCAKFVAKVIDAGYKLGKVPSLFKPNEFSDLENVSLVNKGYDFANYDENITLANLERIKNGSYTEYSDKIIKESTEIENNDKEVNPESDIFIPEKKEALIELLDKTDPDRIFFTSDWHLFKSHYKNEKNLVDIKDIVNWCKKNIRSNDVFFYLGDISYRYATEADQKASKEIMSSIPGIKVLILGNHDIVLGQEYFSECGFTYVFEQFEWNNLIFSHRPLKMEYDQDKINIHGHMHQEETYRTSSGQNHLNVYPYFYNNKPVSLKYLLSNRDRLMKNHVWVPNYGYGESMLPMSRYLQPFIESSSYTDKSMIRSMIKSYIEAQNRPDSATLYFTRYIDSKSIANLVNRFIERLNGNVLIKLHFGEKGNKNFLDPKLLKDTCNLLSDNNISYSLGDCNTAYKSSSRLNSDSHLKTAQEHGFSFLGDIDILDKDDEMQLRVPLYDKINKELEEIKNGNKKAYTSFVTNGDHLQNITTGKGLANYNSMIVYTHVKGHQIAGYGGSIKNIGMGLASGSTGKLQIHGEEFEILGQLFQERLVESTSAICDYFGDNIIYINVIANLSLECDCDSGVSAKDRVCSDIGVLCGTDIVAIEQASLDLIKYNQKAGELSDQIANKAGHHGIEYANNLNMGSVEYKIYDVDNDKLITYPEESLQEATHFKWILKPDFELKVNEDTYNEIRSILDKTPLDHIYLSSDWHLFKYHYSKSAEISYKLAYDMIKWCRSNIKKNDVFIYLGDMGYKNMNESDKLKIQAIFKSIPGIKILILGNHEVLASQEIDGTANSEFYNGCGFDYILEELEWKNILFSHMPLPVHGDTLNIHGHIHLERNYYDKYSASGDPNTIVGVDGKHHVNVYPAFYDYKPVTLKYLLDNKKELMKDNYIKPVEEAEINIDANKLDKFVANFKNAMANYNNRIITMFPKLSWEFMPHNIMNISNTGNPIINIYKFDPNYPNAAAFAKYTARAINRTRMATARFNLNTGIIFMKVNLNFVNSIQESANDNIDDKSIKDIDSILSTLSEKEKYYVGRNPLTTGVPILYKDIQYDENGKPNGFITVRSKKLPDGNGYVQIATSKESRGKGVARTLTSKMLKTFNNPNVKNVYYKIDNGNTPSENFAKSMGFKFEGQDQIDDRKVLRYNTQWSYKSSNIKESTNEEIITESVKGYKYIHLSRDLNLDGKVFTPRIPDTRMIDKGMENSNIPRVCFSEGSIDQALAAIIDYKAYKEMTNCKYAVYVPERENFKKMSNSEIVNNKYVFDAHVTKEMWCLEPIRIRKVGEIFVTSDIIKEVAFFNYNDKSGNSGVDSYRIFKWYWEDETINESIDNEKYNPNFSPNDKLDLNSYRMQVITSSSQFNDIIQSIQKQSNDNNKDHYIKDLTNYYKWIQEQEKNNDRKMIFIIWLDNYNLVAYAIIQQFKSGENFLTSIYVTPNYRSQGLGRQIMEYIINKYDVNELSVEPENKVAINMYNSLGFKITDKYNNEIESNDRKLYMIRESNYNEYQNDDYQSFIECHCIAIDD